MIDANTGVDDGTGNAQPPVQPIPPGTTVVGAPRIAFNVESTLRSPFFWLVVGVVAGIVVCKKSKDWFH